MTIQRDEGVFSMPKCKLLITNLLSDDFFFFFFFVRILVLYGYMNSIPCYQGLHFGTLHFALWKVINFYLCVPTIFNLGTFML
jgi:hypothetical protein